MAKSLEVSPNQVSIGVSDKGCRGLERSGSDKCASSSVACECGVDPPCDV